MNDGEVGLVARDLGVRRGGRFILQGLDLDVPPKARVGLAGPSGAGKSTAARALSGALVPDHGEVRLQGVQLRPDRRDLRRRVPLIDQHPDEALDPRLNVDRVLAPFASGPARKQALEAIGLSAAVLDRPVGILSGGQQQRLVLARALLVEPSVLVLDEPTSALDRGAARAIVTLLNALSCALVVISHDLSLLAELCDELVVLDGGREVERGPASLLSHPRHPTTARLVEAGRTLGLGRGAR